MGSFRLHWLGRIWIKSFILDSENPAYRAIPLLWPPLFLYPVDFLMYRMLKEAETSWTRVTPGHDDTVLSALGNWNPTLPGRAAGERKRPHGSLGVMFFEANPLKKEQIDEIRAFDRIVVGSSWNRDALREMGIASRLVFQGVDTDLFRPLRKRLFKDRFVIFSGGKLEFRKGQDLVLKAFSQFSKRHSDALLITAWRSPEEQKWFSSINLSKICEPIVQQQDVKAAIENWIRANGVDARQFICLEAAPNRLMPEIFREVDLAIFPNRCEGGTNLVAMEALSSGVTCAISANTGHLDIIKFDNCLALKDQKAVDELPSSSEGWGESNVEEILEAMEKIYTSNDFLDADKIRTSVADMSWETSIGNLLSETSLA